MRSTEHPLRSDVAMPNTCCQVMRKRDLIRKNLVENACFEKEIMSSANNPFIVRSYYSFTSKDNLYIVMEYISGGDTASLLRGMGALDESVARQYIAETVLVCSSCMSRSCNTSSSLPGKLHQSPW